MARNQLAEHMRRQPVTVRRHWSMTRLVVSMTIAIALTPPSFLAVAPARGRVVAAASQSQVSRPLGMDTALSEPDDGR